MSRRTRTAQPIRSDFGPEIVDPQTGEVRYAIPVEVVEVPLGPNTRATYQRGRRADPLNRIDDVTDAMKIAAERFRRYDQHRWAGLGAGPPDPSVERVQEARAGDGFGVKLMAQERAYTASVMYTRGEEAIGPAIDVVLWVVIHGKPIGGFDALRRWREGSAKRVLLPALQRLAVEYGCA
jgi:hypothetical protein